MTHEHFLIDDLYVGWQRTVTRRITEADLHATIQLTGDQGGYHVDEGWAQTVGFHTVITPGLLQAGMVTRIGGELNYLAKEITFRYLKPVYVGDTLRATMTVTEVDRDRNRIALAGEVTNQHGEVVLACDTHGYLPRAEWGKPAKPPPVDHPT